MPTSHVVIDGVGRHVKGWRPDKPDPRDLRFRGAALGRTPKSLGYAIADRSDLSHLFPKVEDQATLGCCVMFAWEAVYAYLWRKRGRSMRFSKLFGYYAARVRMEGRVSFDDSGLEIRDGAKAIAKYGLCEESTWPYVISAYASEPTRAAFTQALDYQAIRYYRLSDIDWIRACLSMGYPVVFGFAVPQSFAKETPSTAELRYPGPEEKFIGGHAVVAVGHSDTRKIGEHTGALLCRNSWGETFGDRGHFWMPYEFFHYFLALDAWTLHEVEDGPRRIF